MKIFQLPIVFISGILFCAGIYNLLRVIIVYKKINKFFFFAITTICATFVVIFQLLLSFGYTPEITLVLHRLKMAFIIVGLVNWMYCIYGIYFNKSKIPHIFLIVSAIIALFVPFNIFLSMPLNSVVIKYFGFQFNYLIGTANIMYTIFALLVVGFFGGVSIVKFIFSHYPLRTKVTGIIAFIPGIVCINDFAITHNLINNIMISEYFIFLFIMVAFFHFIREEMENYLIISNMNGELEKKIEQRTSQLKESNDKLMHCATTDRLTGLLNRHELHRRLDEEINRAKKVSNKKKSSWFSLLFIDMDNFKYFNDTFGHHVGDLILSEFAGLLKAFIRDTDIVARFGGDEFVMILPGMDENGGANLAKRILDEVHTRNHFLPEIRELMKENVQAKKKNKLTCSIGISEYNHKNVKELHSVFKYADFALLKAKKEGKNCYKIWK